MQVGSGREKLPLFDPRRAVTSFDFARCAPWPHLTTASNLHKKSFKNWCIGDGDYQLCSADLWISSSLNFSFWMKDVGKHYTFWRFPTVYSCFGFVLQIMTDTPKYITSLTLKEYSGQDRQCWDTCPVFGQLWLNGGITFPVGRVPCKYGASTPFSRSESWDRHILHSGGSTACQSSTPLTLCFFICHCFLFPHSLTTIAIPIWTQT